MSEVQKQVPEVEVEEPKGSGENGAGENPPVQGEQDEEGTLEKGAL